LAKKKKTNILKTPPTYSVTKSLIGSTIDRFDNVYFWIKVLKVSALIFIPYWLFGFETGLFVGIIFACMLLSKISLTVQDMNENLKKQLKTY
jgi:hypothetical protein